MYKIRATGHITVSTSCLNPPFLLQAEFSEHHEAQVGNEAIVKGLVELRKYWDALEGDFRVEVSSEDGEDEKKGRTHSVNHGVSTASEASVFGSKCFKAERVTAAPGLSFQLYSRCAQSQDKSSQVTPSALLGASVCL